MTDNELDPEPTTTPEQVRPGGHDDLLAFIAQIANSGISISITLTTHGMLISGTTISGYEYYQRLKSDTDNYGKGEGVKSLHLIWDHAAEMYGDPAAPDAEEQNPAAIAFIHLKDVFVPGQAELSQWRGRLSEITGWNLGQMKPA